MEDEGFTVIDVSLTSTVSLACATVSEKWVRTSRPEPRTIFCSSDAKPANSTVTRYSPSGTASKRNSPASLLLAVFVQAESAACNVICAPCTGRCCGSWIRPLTVPKMVAPAFRLHNSNPIKNNAPLFITYLRRRAKDEGSRPYRPLDGRGQSPSMAEVIRENGQNVSAGWLAERGTTDGLKRVGIIAIQDRMRNRRQVGQERTNRGNNSRSQFGPLGSRHRRTTIAVSARCRLYFTAAGALMAHRFPHAAGMRQGRRDRHAHRDKDPDEQKHKQQSGGQAMHG